MSTVPSSTVPSGRVSIDSDKLKKLIEAARAKKALAAIPALSEGGIASVPSDTNTTIQADSNSSSNTAAAELIAKISQPAIPAPVPVPAISYNTEQLLFIETAASGADCILIGAAGTGKTTCMKGTCLNLISSGRAGILDASGHKHLVSGTPGIVVCAYTRRAVANIRKNLSADMASNCITIHKLLEYEPVYNTVTDPETGDEYEKMNFEPTRNSSNPLPNTIHTIIFEESSMISVELFQMVIEALDHKVQFIFLGDIQQLPPVFGAAILGFKMLELVTVELTQVYRQALESPIIRLAHRILSGVPIPATEYPDWKIKGKLTLHPWKKELAADTALYTLAKFFKDSYDAKVYDPEADVILIPFNKSCGTDDLNKYIANHISKINGRATYEIIAGFNKHYFSVGDKVLYDKEDAIISNITINPKYHGKQPQAHSPHLDYFGYNSEGYSPEAGTYSDDDIDYILEAAGAEDEDRLRASSHIVSLKMADREIELKLDSAAAINALSLGYAMTVHKSQGSEWRKVFLCLHKSHATMVQRELLYTGCTRAKEELYVICEKDSFTKGILNQRIKGNTLAEKAIYFQGKLDREMK